MAPDAQSTISQTTKTMRVLQSLIPKQAHRQKEKGRFGKRRDSYQAMQPTCRLGKVSRETDVHQQYLALNRKEKASEEGRRRLADIYDSAGGGIEAMEEMQGKLMESHYSHSTEHRFDGFLEETKSCDTEQSHRWVERLWISRKRLISLSDVSTIKPICLLPGRTETARGLQEESAENNAPRGLQGIIGEIDIYAQEECSADYGISRLSK
jgi:hypothetical protein